VRRACSASHLIFGDDDVVTAGAHLDGGYRAGLAYFRDLAAAERPSGVTCYNDLVAIGLCRALSELGLRVPEDVSIVGFDDIPLTEFVQVPLTTVRVPKFRMGELAAEMLIRHVESKAVVPPQRAYLDSQLVVRRSTAAHAGGGVAMPPGGTTVPAASRREPAVAGARRRRP
jgi:LacI family transcriptional regulator